MPACGILEVHSVLAAADKASPAPGSCSRSSSGTMPWRRISSLRSGRADTAATMWWTSAASFESSLT